MSISLELALRYLRSKKRAFVSVGTMFAVIGVALGVAALTTVMSVTGGFREQFRDKVLGVNAHVLVLKYTSDFREYRKVMHELKHFPGVIGIAPFVINPMMVTHGNRTATGVLLKGVDPKLMPSVLDLPRHIVEGNLKGLRLPGAKPPPNPEGAFDDDDLAPPLPLSAQPLVPPLPPSAEPLMPPAPSGSNNVGEQALLKAMRDSFASDAGVPRDVPESAAPMDAGATADAGEAADDGGPLPKGAPVGNIEPDGGYASKLPDDDVLPPDINPDPCANKQAIKKLPGIIIGITLKKNLGAEIGDCVTVTSPTIGYSFVGGALRPPVAKQFRVIAVFDAGFDQYDSKLVYTDLYEAQALQEDGDSVTGVEMKVNDIDNAHEISQAIDKKLNNGLYHTMDWYELNHGLFTALLIQQIIMSLVLALIIIVAAFTVIATLIMIVLDKKREIAVLKAMGARNGELLRAFLYQGAFIGLFGTAIGLALGYAVCKGLLVYGFPLDPKVYFISRLPVQVKPVEFVMVGVFAVLVCLVATVWPALYAARLRPAEAFREQQ
jgi:lipoprotein-releasing system permease protein